MSTLLFHIKRNALTYVQYLSKNYYRTPFENLLLSVTNVIPTPQGCPSTMLLLMSVHNQEYEIRVWPQMTKCLYQISWKLVNWFENWKNKKCAWAHTEHKDLIRISVFFKKESMFEAYLSTHQWTQNSFTGHHLVICTFKWNSIKSELARSCYRTQICFTTDKAFLVADSSYCKWKPLTRLGIS
jgi:hypothetical protein